MTTACAICGAAIRPPARVCSIECGRRLARARVDQPAPSVRPRKPRPEPHIPIGDVPTFAALVEHGPTDPTIVRIAAGEVLPVSLDVWWTEDAGALTLHAVQSHMATPANAIRIILAAPIVGERPHFDLTFKPKHKGKA
jgi:hypothetical protein